MATSTIFVIPLRARIVLALSTRCNRYLKEVEGRLCAVSTVQVDRSYVLAFPVSLLPAGMQPYVLPSRTSQSQEIAVEAQALSTSISSPWLGNI